MKHVLLFCTFVLIGQRALTQTPIRPTDQELKTTCTVLAKLTDTAINNNQKAKITLYYNTYCALQETYTFADNCDTYFKEIKSRYGNDMGVWTIKSDYPPKRAQYQGNNFTNNEKDLIEKIRRGELTDKDIQKLQEMMGAKQNKTSGQIKKAP